MPEVIVNGKPFVIEKGTELKDACRLNSQIPIKFGCRRGDCGTCVIKVITGKLSPITKVEKATLIRLKASKECRLACQCAIVENSRIVTD